ncbi:hypothetical protein RF11_07015 [Thelohanellus kitauei]|uniref:Uncharacterized protein n=1 Tax=Thelohanellus kitauei TaxID=669202 RepID=A0A0C2MV13_THEKT|nr:hypothetical protein RF11_07015 [Thelohanellus kitauei]
MDLWQTLQIQFLFIFCATVNILLCASPNNNTSKRLVPSGSESKKSHGNFIPIVEKTGEATVIRLPSNKLTGYHKIKGWFVKLPEPDCPSWFHKTYRRGHLYTLGRDFDYVPELVKEMLDIIKCSLIKNVHVRDRYDRYKVVQRCCMDIVAGQYTDDKIFCHNTTILIWGCIEEQIYLEKIDMEYKISGYKSPKIKISPTFNLTGKLKPETRKFKIINDTSNDLNRSKRAIKFKSNSEEMVYIYPDENEHPSNTLKPISMCDCQFKL